jgi:hypothetical protein
MQTSIHPTAATRVRRARWLAVARRPRWLAVATLVSGVLVAGCGGSSGSPTAATVAGASAPVSATTGTGAATTTGAAATVAGSPGLAFAECMRSNGVPNFPDPLPGRGLLFGAGAGINPASPAVKAAQAKCRKLLPGGPPGPGSTTHPSAQTLAKLLKIAVCMRQHGIRQFPDPRTSVPSNFSPAVYDDITDFDGAILLFPVTINLQSPAYKQALAACGAPPLGLPH